jgi:deaminated glutathione amidase
MTANIRVAVVQLTSRQNVRENLDACATAVAEAVSRGAQLCAIPENFAYMGPEQGKLALAETIDQDHPEPILYRMMALARQHRVHLLCGGLPERSRTPGKCLNASVLLGPHGGIVGIYRKMHLFDVSIPGRAEYRESEVFEGGPEPVVVGTELGPIGLSICYDLRFPELYRAETAAGARLLAVPSAFTEHTGKDHWHVLVRARAVENECFVLAPNQCGPHGEKIVTYGHSLIVDPWGTVLADVGDQPGVAVADLDFDYQDKVRLEVPCLSHRRM